MMKYSHISWLVRDTIPIKIVSMNNVIRCLQATCQETHLYYPRALAYCNGYYFRFVNNFNGMWVVTEQLVLHALIW